MSTLSHPPTLFPTAKSLLRPASPYSPHLSPSPLAFLGIGNPSAPFSVAAGSTSLSFHLNIPCSNESFSLLRNTILTKCGLSISLPPPSCLPHNCSLHRFCRLRLDFSLPFSPLGLAAPYCKTAGWTEVYIFVIFLLLSHSQTFQMWT